MVKIECVIYATLWNYCEQQKIKTLNAKLFPNPQQRSRITFFLNVFLFASLANALSEMEETLQQLQTAPVQSSKTFDTSKYIH